MPRLLALASLALVATPLVAADLPGIQQRGSLRVLAVHEDLFFSLQTGSLPGLDREILDGFLSLRKLSLEVVKAPGWDQMIPWLLEGKGDLIAGGYAVTDGRLRQITFSFEVFPSRKVSFNRKPAKPVASLDQLRAGRVCTVKGTSMAEAVAAAAVPVANVEYVPSGTLPAALKAGKCAAAVLGVEHAILEQRKDPEIQIGTFLGDPVQLAFGLRKEDALLLRALNDYIDNVRHTPTWNRLVVKYLGDDAVQILRRARESK